MGTEVRAGSVIEVSVQLRSWKAASRLQSSGSGYPVRLTLWRGGGDDPRQVSQSELVGQVELEPKTDASGEGAIAWQGVSSTSGSASVRLEGGADDPELILSFKLPDDLPAGDYRLGLHFPRSASQPISTSFQVVASAPVLNAHTPIANTTTRTPIANTTAGSDELRAIDLDPEKKLRPIANTSEPITNTVHLEPHSPTMNTTLYEPVRNTYPADTEPGSYLDPGSTLEPEYRPTLNTTVREPVRNTVYSEPGSYLDSGSTLEPERSPTLNTTLHEPVRNTVYTEPGSYLDSSPKLEPERSPTLNTTVREPIHNAYVDSTYPKKTRVRSALRDADVEPQKDDDRASVYNTRDLR